MAESASARSPTTALVMLCATQFVLQLDFSIVNIALQAIEHDLHFDPATLQWVVTGYALTYGALLLLGGRLGDIHGRRRMLIAGLWLFGAASVVCGVAVTPAMLVVARCVQGVGAAQVAPGILAILTSVYTEGPERARALGIWAAANAAGGMTGLVAGGVLAEYLGWRSVFLVNVPIIIVLLALAERGLPDLPGDRTTRPDPLGALSVTAAIAALIFGLSNGDEHGFGSPASVAAFVVFGAGAIAFVVIERTVAAPMIPAGFLARPMRRTLLLVMLVIGGVFAASAYFMALYLQRVLGFSQLTTACAILPLPIIVVIASTQLTRRLIARLGLKGTLMIGLVIALASQLWLSRLPSHGYASGALPGLILTAFAAALVFQTVTLGLNSGVAPGERGLAGGLLPTTQQIGSAMALALLATVAASTTRGHHGSLVSGYRASYLTAAVLVAVTTIVVAVSRFGPQEGPTP